MTARLPEEIREAVANSRGPVYIDDPQSNTSYVVLSASDYDRIRSMLLPEHIDIRETYPAQEQVARQSGWEDPLMDEYNDYDAHR